MPAAPRRSPPLRAVALDDRSARRGRRLRDGARTGIAFPDGYDAGGPADAATTFLAKLRSDGTTAGGDTPAGRNSSSPDMATACRSRASFDGGALGDAPIAVTHIAP
jgi:hypothetical protein